MEIGRLGRLEKSERKSRRRLISVVVSFVSFIWNTCGGLLEIDLLFFEVYLLNKVLLSFDAITELITIFTSSSIQSTTLWPTYMSWLCTLVTL